jgi:hypothetical protein
VLVVHQQFLGHKRESQLGLGQCGAEEGRVPPGIYLALLQQEEHHLGGRQKINHNVIQEGTQGLVLDHQACHEESHNV